MKSFERRSIKVILCLLILMITPAQLSSTDKLVLFVNGEAYERDYPDNINDYRILVDNMANMYNDLDKSFREYAKDDLSYLKNLKLELTILENDNKALSDALNDIKNEFDDYKKKVDKMNKRKTKLTAFISCGPDFSNIGIGTNINMMLSYRLLSNFHFGLNTGMSVYNNNELTIRGTVGITIGYSLF